MWNLLRLAVKQLCPQCHQRTLFTRWNQLASHCSICGLQFIKDPVDHGMWLYFSTAAITGLFVFIFLIIGFPSNWTWRSIILAGAFALMWLTAPYRKALVILIDYKTRSAS